MLDVAVRFQEKDATIRYLPGQVGLDAILKRYEDTPFDVTPDGPVVTVARGEFVTLRGWSTREDPKEKAAPKKQATKAAGGIRLFVEARPAKGHRAISPPKLSLAPAAGGLQVSGEFSEDPGQPGRFSAAAVETISLKPGEIIAPVVFCVEIADEAGEKREVDGNLDVVVRTPKAPRSDAAPTGVALIDGTLELRLGHLCDQRGCVSHFHKSLADIAGLAAVRPRPDLKRPGATVHLRAGQSVDLWSMREKLRAGGVEMLGVAPRRLSSYRIRVELPRWRADKKSEVVEQCVVCRDEIQRILQEQPWLESVEVAGGGLNARAAKPEVELVALLDAIADSGVAPIAVWLVPSDAAMPKSAAARMARPPPEPKQLGSLEHPVVSFQFAHTCEVGTDLVTLLRESPWASRAAVKSTDDSTLAAAHVGDRKFANVASLLGKMRSAGRVPSQVRLAEFGDIRIQLEFAHLCGEVEYSKPPKKKKPAKKKAGGDAGKKDEKGAAKDDKKKPRPKPKPFVPKPLRPAKSSHARKAIEAAVGRVGWVKQAVFLDFHTKPTFNGPRRFNLSFEVKGRDAVRLDELIDELRRAGFPPKSVLASRRFPGIPFGKRLPGDLRVTDQDGKQQSLASLQKPGRPLAVAFVSLKCKRYKKYKPDPKLYEHMLKTVDRYKDRIDFVAISANPDDKFADVAGFWGQTGAETRLLHDAEGAVRGAFNAQATPPPHFFVFDADAKLRFAGDPHNHFEAPEKKKNDYLARAFDLLLAGKFEANGAVFYNKSVCNCSDPNCKCPKCGCGATCRCTIKH